MSIDDAKIKQIEKGLQHGGLYVDPSLAGKVPAAMQAKIKAAIARQDVPVKVIAVPNAYSDPTYHGRPELLIGTVHSDLGGDGAYFAASTASDLRVEASTFGSVPDAWAAAGLASLQHPDDLGAQLLASVENYQKSGVDAAYDKALAQRSKAYQSEQATSPDHGGDSSGHPVLIGGGLIVALLVIAAVLLRRRRRTAVPAITGARTTDRPFTLPASVLSTITQTRDREREESVDSEVLALGEAIDTAPMRPGAGAGAWQAALDQYDLARRILDRKHSPADTVGAMVLARRGHAALDAAVAGRSWAPTPTCYFNPAHGPGTKKVTWKGENDSVDVPACAACARAVGAGREPDDVLDFADGDRRRHYFDLDLGVWSRTGYGALDTDLVKRLFATG